MAEQAKIMTLHDHDTGEAIAPRTDVKALSGEGKKWNYVGFTEDDQIGLIEGTWLCNWNLLDNWYFGVKSSIINQRGKDEYLDGVYTIDRWALQETNDTLTVKEGYIEIAPKVGQSYCFLLQAFDDSTLVGKQVTFSCLLTDNNIYSVTGAIGDSFGSDIPNGRILIYKRPGRSQSHVAINAQNSAIPIQVVAAKLEVGSQQTLAHKEGDTWVLNEIPNYATELMKCQRYYQVFKTSSMRPVEAEDFRPVMRARPAPETISIGGQTYYTADANL